MTRGLLRHLWSTTSDEGSSGSWGGDCRAWQMKALSLVSGTWCGLFCPAGLISHYPKRYDQNSILIRIICISKRV